MGVPCMYIFVIIVNGCIFSIDIIVFYLCTVDCSKRVIKLDFNKTRSRGGVMIRLKRVSITGYATSRSHSTASASFIAQVLIQTSSTLLPPFNVNIFLL